MMDIQIKLINPNDKDYAKALALRLETLGEQPIALDINNQELNEQDDFHCLAYINDEIIACVVLTIIDSNIIKMRQLGVKSSYRGLGISKQMIKYAETLVKTKNYQKIILNARTNVISLYESLGYKKTGNEFNEVGITHIAMYKNV